MLFSGSVPRPLLLLEHSILDLSSLNLMLLFELLGAEAGAILASLASSSLALLALAGTRLSQSLLTPLLVSQLKLSPLLSPLHSPSLGSGGLSCSPGLVLLNLLLSLDLSFALSFNDGFLSLDSLSLLLSELLDASLLVSSLGFECLLLLLASSGFELASALGLLLLSLFDHELASALGSSLSALSFFLSLALNVQDTSALEHSVAVPLSVDSAFHRIFLTPSVVCNVSHVVGMVAGMMRLVNSVPVSTSSHLLLLIMSMLISTVGLNISSLSAGSSSLQETLMVGLAEFGCALTLHSLSLLEKDLSSPCSCLSLSFQSASKSHFSSLLLTSLSKHGSSSSLLLLELFHSCSAKTGSLCSMNRSNVLSCLGNSSLALSHVLADLSLNLPFLWLLVRLLSLSDLCLLFGLLLSTRPRNSLLIGLNLGLCCWFAFPDFLGRLFHPSSLSFSIILCLDLRIDLYKSVFLLF